MSPNNHQLMITAIILEYPLYKCETKAKPIKQTKYTIFEAIFKI